MTPRIGYLLHRPPRHSETFIVNEILALQRYGIPDAIFVLRGDQGQLRELPKSIKDLTSIISTSTCDLDLSLSEIVDTLDQAQRELSVAIRTANRKFKSRADEEDAMRRFRPLWQIACAIRLISLCRQHGTEHLHCHCADAPAEVGLLVKRLSGIPFSFTGHAKDIFTLSPDRLRPVIEEAEWVVSCSAAGVKCLRDAAPEHSERIHLVHHGINIDDWITERAQPNGKARIVSVGRLTPKKGFPVLLQATDLLRRTGIDVELEIIGEGYELPKIDGMIKDLGMGEAVTLRGKLSQGEIRKSFSRATVFALSSIILPSNNQDGIANAVLEAMAVGLPVVVSDIPGLTEIVEDELTGLVSPAGDPAALADRLQRLIQNPSLRTTIAEAGRRSVAHLDCTRAAEKLTELFNGNDQS